MQFKGEKTEKIRKIPINWTRKPVTVIRLSMAYVRPKQ